MVLRAQGLLRISIFFKKDPPACLLRASHSGNNSPHVNGGSGIIPTRSLLHNKHPPHISRVLIPQQCASRHARQAEEQLSRESWDFANAKAEGPKISDEISLCMLRIIHRLIGETIPRSNGASV